MTIYNHITPIIHLTNKCNLACKYCYTGSALESFLDYKKIKESFYSKIPVLFDFMDQTISYNKFTPTTFFFHGGEPLLVGLENWNRILNYSILERNYPMEVSVQTNGTLINDDFIDLFKRFDVKIGVSLDGPASLNDHTRVFKNGEGSFSTIFRNLQKMRNADLNVGCLVTLTGANIKYVESIYAFFKKYSIPFNVRTIFKAQYYIPSGLLITPREYASAVCKLFDLWFDDAEIDTFLIGDFAKWIAQFIKPIEGLSTCTFIKNCSKYFVSFDMNGNLWVCDGFIGEDDFLYGNVQKDNLVNLLNSPKAKRFSRRWEVLSNTSCKNCVISHYCYGGCPERAYTYYGNYFSKDYFCEAYKIIFKHAYMRIKKSI